MDDREYYRLLGVGRSVFDSLEPHLERRDYEGRTYRHLPDARRGIERGTALIAGEIVRGFPKIPRTLVLETGIPTQFDGPVAVEEKLNGYNVRVARIDGDRLAFSRSGMVCPFTTRTLERLVDLEALFEDHPRAMVCGEVIGPENPYTAHDYPDVDSLAFRAFDWRDRRTGDPLPVRERRDRYERYGVPQTAWFGVHGVDEAADETHAVVHALEEERREGVVLKSTDGRRQLKYTTSAASRDDLAHAFALPFEYGRQFLFRRLIREGFRSVELEESDAAARERAHALGEAVLLSMRDAIRTVEAGETIGERHTVRASPETVDVLLEHLRGQGLEIEIESDGREEGDRVLAFRKRVQSSNDRIRNSLEGQVVGE